MMVRAFFANDKTEKRSKVKLHEKIRPPEMTPEGGLF